VYAVPAYEPGVVVLEPAAPPVAVGIGVGYQRR
jgi:hypothetical protein